jgi:hypothetical protein
MMRKIFILTCVALISAGCSSPSPQIYIRRPSTGATYGPVYPANNTSVYIGENKYELITANPRETETLRILTTHFPLYDFGGCSLSDAVYDMNKMIKDQFPKSKVHIKLLEDTFWTKPSPFEPKSKPYMPKLTFSAKDVPLMTVVEIVCGISGAHFNINGQTITIRAGDVQQSN